MRSRSPTTTGSRSFNRNGVVVARAVVSHRVPSGVGLMYHSQDRHVNVPLSEITEHARRHGQLRHPHLDEADAPDRRIRTALVRLQLLRPDAAPSATRWSPCASCRGRLATDAGSCPDRDGDEPRQVHRVPHLLGHLQERLDEPPRHGVRLVQRRRDEARGSATRSSWEDQDRWKGGWELNRAASCGSGQAVACASSRRSSSTPSCPRSTTTTSPGRTTTRR